MKISTTSDIAACHALRLAVFVEEQGISHDDEFDDLDATATHLLAEQDGKAIGTARLVFLDDTVKLGRICVLPEARGTGVGRALIAEGIALGKARHGITRAYLSAQTNVIPFYESLGFRAYGEVYDDAGIPHQDMERSV